MLAGRAGSTARPADGAGAVTGRFVEGSEIIEVQPDGSVSPAALDPQWLGYVYMVAKDVPAGPVQVRAWLWFGPKGAPTSQYQFVSTGLITVQPLSP